MRIISTRNQQSIIRENRRRRKSSQKQVPEAGHIYVAYTGIEDIYKIGRTKNVQHRINNLRSGNPNLKCVLSVVVKNYILAEQKVHNIFKGKKVQRELYRLSQEDIMTINKYLLEHHR